MKTIFSENQYTNKPHLIALKEPIKDIASIISSGVSEECICKGDAFAKEISNNIISNFEKSTEICSIEDKMVHVSSFCVINNVIYMTYYANTKEASEDPNNQIARLVYCDYNNTQNKVFIDIQSVGDICCGQRVNLLYDTILSKKDDDTLFILWTAKVGKEYYRLYRIFNTKTKQIGEVNVNKYKVGDVINDFSTTGIQDAMAENNLFYKELYSDIGIMQKFTTRVENNELFYYTGVYSGDFSCITKSKDFITWEYVAQPDFPNESKWENATYVIGDKCFYFVRQHDESKYGFLTVYDLNNGNWEKPVLIEDCQSRSDFIEYRGNLYLFHAPIDREHIGIIKINTDDITKSEVVLQANMHSSCFYPFVQYITEQELAMSYTVDRKHIRLAKFTLSSYVY